jgi:adenosyl cobinamide kinase/adenosyl cobinamide phosphate guanylyltransferase
MRVLSEKDRLEYFSPDTAPYQVAAEDLNSLRDEMHRVLHHMAMSIDNSGAALQRSADSKAIDQAAASVILKALGVFIREHLEELLNLVATARKDNVALCAHGMDNFDDVTLTTLVADAIGISTVSIPSAHFQKKFKLKIAKLALGSDASEDDIAKISEELASGVTQDEFEAETMAKVSQHEANRSRSQETLKDPSGVKTAKALSAFGKSKPA